LRSSGQRARWPLRRVCGVDLAVAKQVGVELGSIAQTAMKPPSEDS
jgi:hypothetical protein